MSTGSPSRFPSSRQRHELERFFSDPKIAAYLNAQPWTVDTDHDVPDLAGYSVSPGKLYVDRGLAKAKPFIGRIPFDEWIKALVGVDYQKRKMGHEPAEKAALDIWGYSYETAHEDVATPCEHEIVIALPLDWALYSKGISPWVKRAELETIVNPPLDLDCRPYYQDPDANDLKVLRRLRELGVHAAFGEHPQTQRARDAWQAMEGKQ